MDEGGTRNNDTVDSVDMAPDRLQVLKYLGLVIGCTAKFVTGSLFVFNAYQDDLQAIFNYTQKEMEVMPSMLNIGLGVGFLPGMIYDRFGPQWTSVAGLVISVGAYMLLWSTTRPSLVHFYSTNSWLMAIYFFVAGLGSVFTYMVALNTNIINFDKKHTGKVVGLLNAFFAGSPSVFATLYYHVFKDGDHHDYPGFLLMFAISFGIADLLCIIFLRIYAEKDGTKEPFPGITGSDKNSGAEENGNDFKYKQLADPNTSIQESSGDFSSFPDYAANKAKFLSEFHLPLKKLLVNIDYHILVWMFAFASSVGLVYVTNITTISKSMCTTTENMVQNTSLLTNDSTDNMTVKNATTTCLNAYDDRLTIIIPITNAIVSLSVGLFSDYFKVKLPRLWIVMFACACFLVSQVLVLCFAYKIFFLMLATVFAGTAIGVLWSLAPTIMNEMFYVGNLGRNWGIAILVAALLGFGIQELFGVLYDAQINTTEDHVCHGMSCITGGVATCLASASLSIVLGVVMQLKKSWSRRCANLV